MKKLVFISVPGLRSVDLVGLPFLRSLMSSGAVASLSPGFPAVTCPVQSNMTTGVRAERHGIVANGLYLRDSDVGVGGGGVVDIDPGISRPQWPKSDRLPYIEMWTSPNSAVESPQIWDILRNNNEPVKTAVWFALLSKFCLSDHVCNFAPIHNPDGSESLWCYTRPHLFYGELRDSIGHFPVQGYWGPLAGQSASEWIVDSAVIGADKFKPDYFYIYIPRLDYTPQKFGANAPQLAADLAQLDQLFEKLHAGFCNAIGEDVTWLIAGEYAVTDVNSVVYPNRILRELGVLSIERRDGREYLQPAQSQCFALCDHQFSHLFFNDNDSQLIERVAQVFRKEKNIDEVLVGDERSKYGLCHRRSGEIILVSKPDSWQSYYFWNDDSAAPDYAGKVDIHRKPGYDPVELFWDKTTMSVPLDATLIRGSHGAPPVDSSQKTLLITNNPTILENKNQFNDTDLFNIVKHYFNN
ncbi:MAG: alkaline phosphatase family protein [Planctomycetaceae bacterium]|jgi:predicted AlkP superfamily pyrophosphatase or phosphodiesterase|nr:alkaline phosphatase family protein [Planctomycetaceae bacterium]